MQAVDAAISCGAPADTGAPVLLFLLIAGVLLIAGAVLLLLTRGHHRGAAGTALVLVLVVCGALAPGLTATPAAHASTPGCPAAQAPIGLVPGPLVRSALTIVQTSTMTGLAPGVAPVPIAGTVTNQGTARTFVAAVTVTIAGVRKAVGAVDGVCEAVDYVVLDTTMPVRQALDPGESATFAGARIGFRDVATNQDACQRAVVDLHYVSS